jgi:1,4-dihydroxy-2-naphthoate octaprenyltransferase
VGAAIGVYFIVQVGAAVVPILLAGLVAVLFYTPFFTNIGIGEIAAGAGLGFLPVVGTAVVQQGHASPSAVAAAIPSFFMTFNLLLLNEFPDEKADRAGGRSNLVLLLGRRGAARFWLGAVAATIIAIIGGVVIGTLPVWCLLALLPVLALGPAIGWAVRDPESPVPLPGLGGNVIWNLATNALLAVGFGIALLQR